jgi:hypothetical protein
VRDSNKGNEIAVARPNHQDAWCPYRANDFRAARNQLSIYGFFGSPGLTGDFCTR